MTQSNHITSVGIWNGSTLVVMASVVIADGVTALTQSVTSTITRQVGVKVGSVWNTIAADTLTVASVVFNTLQTTNGWTADALGFNFRDVIPAARFATAGPTRVSYIFTLSDGTVTEFVAEVTVTAPFV